MASSRKKPELEGLDAILPAQSADLVSSVIASDRKRAGRGEYREADTADYDNMTSPMTIGQADGHTDKGTSGMTDRSADLSAIGQAGVLADTQLQPSPSAAPLAPGAATAPQVTPQTEELQRTDSPRPAQRRQQSAAPARATAAVRGAGPSELASRRRSAATAAASRTMTVTLRLPQAMNDWLDEYVHQSWPNRVRKQELVVEALRMLIARRGSAGAPVVPTELLDEE